MKKLKLELVAALFASLILLVTSCTSDKGSGDGPRPGEGVMGNWITLVGANYYNIKFSHIYTYSISSFVGNGVKEQGVYTVDTKYNTITLTPDKIEASARVWDYKRIGDQEMSITGRIAADDDLPITITLAQQTETDYKTVTVHSTASKSELLPQMLVGSSKIKIEGEINQKDFKTLRNYTPLQYLDLSGATVVGDIIVGYNNETSEPLIVKGNAIPFAAFGKSDVADPNDVGETLKEHENLKSVILPTQITYIGRNAFRACKLTEPISFPEGLKAIMAFAFKGCNDLPGELKFPKSLEIIGAAAFGSCRSVTGILTIPPKIEDIAEQAFMGCAGITEINFHDNVTFIGLSSFAGMINIKSLILPKNVEGIDYSAFFGCIGLRGSLILPESLMQIEDRAFVRCGFDGTLTLNKKLDRLAEYAFDETNFKEIVFPWDDAEEMPNNWANFQESLFPANFEAKNNKPEYVIYIPKGTTDMYTTFFPSEDDKGCFYNIKER